MAVSTSKKDSGVPVCSSVAAGRARSPDRGPRTVGFDGLAVDADPLPDGDQVRAGEPARPQAPGPQQRVDHAAVDVLPLVPVMWMTGYARWGSPSSRARVAIRSRVGSIEDSDGAAGSPARPPAARRRRSRLGPAGRSAHPSRLLGRGRRRSGPRRDRELGLVQARGHDADAVPARRLGLIKRGVGHGQQLVQVLRVWDSSATPTETVMATPTAASRPSLTTIGSSAMCPRAARPPARLRCPRCAGAGSRTPRRRTGRSGRPRAARS